MRSLSQPALNSSPAKIIEYTELTHTDSAMPRCRSKMIVGSAMPTMVPSRTIMASPAASTASARQGDVPGRTPSARLGMGEVLIETFLETLCP